MRCRTQFSSREMKTWSNLYVFRRSLSLKGRTGPSKAGCPDPERVLRFDVSRIHVVLLTEDHCDKPGMEAMLRDEGVTGEAFNQRDRTHWLRSLGIEKYAGLIPNRSHAETSFGLLYLWASPQFEYGWFIDDDTLPLAAHDFFGTHLANLEFSGEVDVVSSDKGWVNVLFEKFERHGLYPRGYPYGAMQEQISIRRARVDHVVLSQGLWINVPDLDSIRILSEGDLQGLSRTRTVESDFARSFVVDAGNYVTISSMNLAFRREVVPAFYQLPMDDNPWKIGRYDDIWSGVFLKKACDMLGKSVMTGRPLCVHNKVPRNIFRDLNAEVPALELNEHLWEVVDSVSRGESYAEACLEIADALRESRVQLVNADFLGYLAEHLEKWVECLRLVEGRS